METLKMNHGEGEMQAETFGGVQCKRYVGKFTVSALQDKAETGLWYTLIQGNPHAIEGEGETPKAAIQDSINRTNSRIAEMQQAVLCLTASLDTGKGSTQPNGDK